MAWAAAAAIVLLLAASHIVQANEDPVLDSVLVIGKEKGSNKRKLLQQMSGEPEPLMKWLVAKHNELRYRHGVQLLTWDWSLAWNAYNYVVGCPKGHSGQQGIGENLAWGHNDFNHAMRDWYDEIQFYNFNAPGFGENTGHFSQLVWSDSAKIGCAANLRCSFRTYICQFTPPGNLVNYGGSVDINLWTTQVPAPGAQYVTGTKPDGTPSYMSYDPTGETTRGLPQPRYGELKNFGYVPKPGEVIVMTDWQKFIPTDIIQNYLPWVVLEQYLKPDILDLLKPEPAAVPKPGQAIKREPERAVVGWQEYIPASVIKQYVPAQILAKYVPEGVVLATEKDGVGAVKTPPANVTAPVAGVSTTTSTSTPSDVRSGSVSTAQAAPKEPAAFVAGTSGIASKPQDAPKEPPSFVAAASQIFSPPMKEGYESGRKFRPSRQLKGVSDDVNEQDAVFFREEPALAAAAQARQISHDIRGSAVGAVIRAKAAQQFVQRQLQEGRGKSPTAASKASAVNEQGALDRLFGGLADRLGDNDRERDHYGYASNAPQTPAPQPVYPVVNPTPVYPSNPGYAPVGHVPAQQPAGSQYYVQQAYQPPQQQPMTDAASQYGQVPQVPQALAPQGVETPSGYQQSAAVPLPTDQQGQTTAQQPAQQVAADDTPKGVAPVQQLPAGMQDVLEAHNQYRTKHQVPAVAWDDQLAASAMGVASKCPNSPSGTQGIGENLAWGFRDAGAAVDEWYKEGKQYDFNNPGFTMTSGHFTQIVWADTQRIGCAMVPTCSMPTFICHYFPPGNVMGSDWSTQVKPALPGAPTGPRPRQPAAAVPRPGYPCQTQQPVAAVPYPVYPVQQQQQQQQQPVAAVPYPAYPVQQQQLVQYQPVAAVPYPTGYYAAQQPQVPAVTAVPNPAYNPQQQQQQQQQLGQPAAQPVAAVLKPGREQKLTEGHIVTHPAYQTYQPYPVDAVPKPHQQFVPVVGSAGDERPMVASAGNFHDPRAAAFSAPAVYTPAKKAVTHGTFRSGEGAEPRPVTAATTKPFSAPAFMTPLADAVPKPEALTPTQAGKPQVRQAVSSRGKLPQNAPVQIGVTDPADLPQAVVDQNGKVIAAVGKPPFPVAAPRSHWPHVGRPVSNDGAPFSLSAPTQPAAVAVLSPELQQALDRHNQYRASHQAPPLAWDDSIASSAQSWAAGCPDGHSGTRGVGENMAWGYSSLSDAVNAWYNEVKLYDFNNPGWNTATGHFTAMVWKSTTKLGCAINAACSWPTYVCQYGPPGNVIGLDWSKEVMPKSEVPITPDTPPTQPSVPKPITAPKALEPNTPAPPKQPPTPTPAPTKPSAPKTQQPTKPSQPAPAPTKPSPTPTKPSLAPKKPGKKPVVKGVQLTQEQKVALNKHNMYRAKHNAPALAWDTKLAAVAQAWADSCPWGLSDQPYGENMAWGYNGFADAMEAWYSEVKDYDWGYPAYQAGTGHFSQLVWRSSRKLGCAVSKKCDWKTYVCMYDPAGNIEDESWGSNVQPPTDAVPLPDSQRSVAAVLKPGSDGQAMPVVAAVLKPEYQAALDRHNQYRQTHQAPALAWDDALAASAAQWAAGCPNGHSGYSGVGENMAWGYSSLTDAVDAWYNEVKQYDFSKPGWNTATGHFTAIVWKTTTKLGCATNSACSWATYVCQYQSPGNIIGVDWSQYVKPAVTAVPASPSPAPNVTPPPPSPSPKPLAASPAPVRSPSPAPVVKASPAPVAKASPSPAPLVKASPAPAVKASPAPVAVAPSTAGMQQVLTMHNVYRKTHQAPALVWDEKLAASAKKWADTCTFGVSRTAGVGEALGFGYRTFPDAVTGWYNQVSKYDFNNPGWQSGSGLFTQMVWRDTKAMGCAVNTACSWAMYVCHYSPPGNTIGPSVDWSQQVKPAVTTAAVPKPLADAQAGEGAPDGAAAEDETWDAKIPKEDIDDFTSGMPDPLDSAAPITAAVGLPDSLEPADPDLVEALRRTNLYRKRHQVTALSWDEGLAAQAATFLADCPLKHSYIRNVGESLGWGFRSFSDVVDAWYNEVNSYHFDKPGRSILAGHFSQMVWKDTTKIGCAVNKKCTWDTYICQYSPPGNVVSADWSTQVYPALPDSPEDSKKLWNPTLGPGEAYYSPDRPEPQSDSAADANNQDANNPSDSSSSSSSTVPQYATPVPLDQLTQAPPTRQPVNPATPTAPVTPVTPSADDTHDPAEIPVTPTAPEVTPVQPPQQVTPVLPQQVAPLTLQAQDTATPQQPYEVPTMPAGQVLPQTGANSAGPNPAPVHSTISDSSSSSGGDGSSSGVSSGGSAVPGLDAELQAGLDATNSYRRQHNAPDLVWDRSIAAQAANYVAGCPNGHSQTKGYGENLAWGYASLGAAVKAWYDEVSAYDFNQGGFSGSTGHFTQLVWRDTSKVGCAVNKACSMPTYICQYSPPGNVMGVDWSMQVQPKTNSPTGPSQSAPATPTQPAQPVPVTPTPTNPSWPQQQQQQQQPPVQQSQPQTNWWETPQQQQQQQPQQMQQQPANSLEPTTPTPVTPVPATPTTPQTAPADGSAPAEFAVVFEATNKYRAKHGVPAVTWDAALATRSQAYADACPGGHSGDKGVGENLAWGYPSWQSAVDAWYSEISAYSFSNPGWSGSTGHFTQLVWKDTTKVGCGYNARCAMATYVCQYSPAGNVLGTNWAAEVPPATS